MMRLRKLLSSLMAAAILVSAFAGCNSGTPTSSTTEETGNESSVSTPAEEEETAEEGGGSAEGTPLELWTFQEVHRTFYETMADKWNEANPDKAVNLTVSV
jgi:arabinosaccharide transport system substrate-binding protein